MRRPQRPPELLSGPFTRDMARAVGLTAKQLRSSAWRQLLRGVYVSADVTDSLELRCAAVTLVLPPDAVVGYTAAAWLHGADVRDRLSQAVEVIGQRGDQIRRAGLRASSALLLPRDVTMVCGV